MSLRTEAHCHQNTMNVLFSTTDVCCTGRIFLLSLEYFRPNAQNRCFDRSLRNPFILLRPNPPVIHWCPRMPVVNRLFGQTRNSSHSLFCPVLWAVGGPRSSSRLFRDLSPLCHWLRPTSHDFYRLPITLSLITFL